MLTKKQLFLVTVFLAVFWVCFAMNGFVPVHAVQAGGEIVQTGFSAGPLEQKEKPASQPAQTVVFVGAGLVCILFGVLTVSPLLLADPLAALPDGE